MGCWDFIYNNDMEKLIKECEDIFNEGAAQIMNPITVSGPPSSGKRHR